MSMRRHLVLGSCLLAILVGCSTPHGTPDGTVAVGTFNMEWLGDGVGDRKPRNDADYLRIADIVLKSGADVLGVQEVENETALRRVLRYCEGYDGMVLKGETEQNVGLIWRSNVSVRVLGAYMPLVVQPQRSRPGLVVHCTRDGFDWVMMIVHLKSTSRYDSTNQLREESRVVRSKQAAVLRAWADSVVADGKETDVFIVGDLNDFPTRRSMPTLTALAESSDLRFLTRDLKSCGKGDRNVIDHVVVSSTAARRYIDGSVRTEDFHAFLDAADADKVSDHCPVVARFSIRP